LIKILNDDTKVVGVARGVLDTVPAAHIIGTRMWFIGAIAHVVGTEYTNGDTPGVKILPRTGLGEFAEGSATAYDADKNESGKSVEAETTYDFEVPPIVTDLSASFDRATNILTFSWTYETAWLPKIEKWVLSTSDVAGGPYTKVVDVPYDPLTTPPYTTEVEIPIPATEMVKYYVLTAHRGVDNNSAASANSNEVTVIIDKMPPKSPFELKIKIK